LWFSVNNINPKINIDRLLGLTFWGHVFIIFISVVPAVGQLMPKYTPGRVSGLIGYEIAAYFVMVHLISTWEVGKTVWKHASLLKLLASLIVVLISGRFGLIFVVVGFAYVFFKSERLVLNGFIIVVAVLVLMKLNPDRFRFIESTVASIMIYIKYGVEDGFNAIDKGLSEGYYSASPITWINEIEFVLDRGGGLWMPSEEEISIDSGPFYAVGNLGFPLVILAYSYWLSFFRRPSLRVKLLIVLTLMLDLKLRVMFSPAIMYWLFIHIKLLGCVGDNYTVSPLKGVANRG
jgi:hypothetical protein